MISPNVKLQDIVYLCSFMGGPPDPPPPLYPHMGSIFTQHSMWICLVVDYTVDTDRGPTVDEVFSHQSSLCTTILHPFVTMKMNDHVLMYYMSLLCLEALVDLCQLKSLNYLCLSPYLIEQILAQIHMTSCRLIWYPITHIVSKTKSVRPVASFQKADVKSMCFHEEIMKLFVMPSQVRKGYEVTSICLSHK